MGHTYCSRNGRKHTGGDKCSKTALRSLFLATLPSRENNRTNQCANRTDGTGPCSEIGRSSGWVANKSADEIASHETSCGNTEKSSEKK